MGRDGGFILGSGCEVPITAKVENVAALNQRGASLKASRGLKETESQVRRTVRSAEILTLSDVSVQKQGRRGARSTSVCLDWSAGAGNLKR